MEQDLLELQRQAKTHLEGVVDASALEEFRIEYLGRKGRFSAIMKRLGAASAEDRPRLGQLANTAKREVESLYEEAREKLASLPADKKAGSPDLTLPGRKQEPGRLHPVSQIMNDTLGILADLGFSVVEGPEIEQDYYNFEALNIPPHHPARDMHDTFYVGPSTLLRTHTSPMQARVMEKNTPPLRIIAPGKVYRCDSDLTHTPMFHQVEGLMVDKRVSFADLKGVLEVFVQKVFAKKVKLRFRPSFFPFTEPSAEVDVSCVICSGSGCRVCKKTGWIEILGSGMVDPEVFKMAGYDPDQYSGFAFGLGIERIAMLKYGIDDIRLYYENDLRFLSQF
ncbi:MAG: phenylalanine--tRNA ligase subunit alpha [Deltaproteobacteria bacterium]|nr:MAG: phenylalanine--tRNA ligase subunit alpha [Deltaproteobacteria bacterium]